MKLGKTKLIFFSFLFLFLYKNLIAEDKILTTPVINLENLKPSFEEEDISEVESETNVSVLKKKTKKKVTIKDSIIKLKGLDKITAKTSEIEIKLGEKKLFGMLEIKALKCGKPKFSNNEDKAAYIQVKDLSDKKNEKIFIFNGWTFSSETSLIPFDHAVYDIWLISCENV